MRYGTIQSFLDSFFPGCLISGHDVADCFYTWLVAPAHRRRLGIRHPVDGSDLTNIFFPFGLGASPAVNDANIKEVLRVVRAGIEASGQLPPGIVDFVDDLRILHQVPDGASNEVRARSAQITHEWIHRFISKLGLWVRTKPGK